MFKKIISVVCVCLLVFGLTVPAFAGQTSPLRFHEDGSFTVIHLTDSHIHYPMENAIRTFITEMLDSVQPDLVVLGGDIATDDTGATLEKSIEDICALFTQRKVFFTIIFGNHDREFGKTGEELLALYTRYGAPYFLGYDADESLSGCGTHDLPILSSDGTKTAFNLYMFDSGDYVYDADGNYLGYDCVHEDTIEWYKNRAAQLKEKNNGETVPALAFQHIIVQEIDDALFYPVENSAGDLGEDFDGNSILFTPIPKIRNITDGVILEKPCPGYYNCGQLEAMQETGDVLAVFSGHDHSNTFTVNIGGVDVVNTGGCKMQAPFRLFTSGVRVITLNENNPRTYESEMLSLLDMADADNSAINAQGELEKTDTVLSRIFEKIITVVMRLLDLFRK